MVRDRYAPLNLFEVVAALGMEVDPVLMRLDSLLDEDTLFQAVKVDLACRFPRTVIDGRPSTPVEVVLRMLVVKHLYGWSYAQTEHWVSDSLILRQFCRVYAQRVPDDTTLLRWANLIQPATLHNLLAHVVDLARRLPVTHGRKLRIDGTVVETNIRYPVDSTLLGDGVRVLTRTLQRAKQMLHTLATVQPTLFRDRTRSVRRVMHRLIDAARRRGEQAEQALHTPYQQLLELTTTVVRQAKQVEARLKEHTTTASRRLASILEQVIPRVEQVLVQTTRRVVLGATVPADDKLVSLFEPHTAIIRKGKTGHPVEFGRVVWLDEVEGGIISRYAVLQGNPNDADQLRPSLDHHRQQFGRPPNVLAGDRKTFSPEHERYAQKHGGKQVVLPRPGRSAPQRVQHERQRGFRRGRNWRAGIEGRISVLKRRHTLRRCLYHGSDGLERWVGWGILAHNLHRIAQATAYMSTPVRSVYTRVQKYRIINI
ncbi:MAG TPA: ISNCY family transposase [Chloroflexota bacterium]|nr:ISNCY family transposase [Chloroflexota bacterium]